MSRAHAIAQLRHLYSQMLGGHVQDTAEAARGLLGPAIESLEDTSEAVPSLLAERLARVERDRDAYCVTLGHTQRRCTELLHEARAARELAQRPGMAKVLAAVVAERRDQDARFGAVESLADVPDGTDRYGSLASLIDVRESVKDHCAETGRETCCWAHVLEEEVAEALAETDAERLRAELVQVAAVCVRWVEAIDARAAKRSAP